MMWGVWVDLPAGRIRGDDRKNIAISVNTSMSCAPDADKYCRVDQEGNRKCESARAYYIQEGFAGCNSVHTLDDQHLYYQWGGGNRTLMCDKKWERLHVDHAWFGVETGQLWVCPE